MGPPMPRIGSRPGRRMGPPRMAPGPPCDGAPGAPVLGGSATNPGGMATTGGGGAIGAGGGGGAAFAFAGGSTDFAGFAGGAAALTGAGVSDFFPVFKGVPPPPGARGVVPGFRAAGGFSSRASTARTRPAGNGFATGRLPLAAPAAAFGPGGADREMAARDEAA